MSQYIEENVSIDLSDEPLETALNASVDSDERSVSLANRAARKSSVMEILAKKGFSCKAFAIIIMVLSLLTTSFAALKWFVLKPQIDYSDHLKKYQTCSEFKGKTLYTVGDPEFVFNEPSLWDGGDCF